jgi:hypothetical protein
VAWSNDPSSKKFRGSLLTEGPVADVAGSLILASSTFAVLAGGGSSTAANRKQAE